MEHSKIDIENDDYQFADINLFGSTSGDLGSDQEHSNEDMAIEHGLPGKITGEKEIMQYFVDYDSNKDTHNISGSQEYITGVMGQWLEHLPHNQKVMGSSPGRVIPKTLKMVLTAFSSGARHIRKEWGS